MSLNNVEGSGNTMYYDIGTNEFVLPYTRNGKRVYGIEVDCGALPNTTTKTVVIPNYNASYRYWLYSADSYALNSSDNSRMTLPYVSANAGIDYNVNTYTTGNSIKIATYANLSAYTAKVVLHYTKD